MSRSSFIVDCMVYCGAEVLVRNATLVGTNTQNRMSAIPTDECVYTSKIEMVSVFLKEMVFLLMILIKRC